MPVLLKARPLGNAEVEIRFPYNPDTVDTLKSFGGARFNGDRRDPAWVVGADLVPVLEREFGRLFRWEKKAFPLAPRPEVEEHPLYQKLRGYQQEGARFLSAHAGASGALLADDPGIGKTVQAIAASVGVPKGLRVVLCPNTATHTWRAEIPKWLEGEPVFSCVGKEHQFIMTPEGRQLPILSMKTFDFLFERSKSPWLVCHFEVLVSWTGWLQARQPVLLLMDEGQMMSNRKAQRTQAAIELRRAPSIQACWAMTATPMRSGPKNLWSIVELIRPGAFGGHWREGNYVGYWKWAGRYCGGALTAERAEYTQWDDNGSQNEEELALRLSSFMLRRAREDVLDDLPYTRTFTEVFLDPEWRARYSKLEEKILERSSGGMEDLEPLCELTSQFKLPIAIGKALEIARSGHKVVLFTHFHSTVAGFQKAFDKLKEDVHVTYVPGTIPVGQRPPLYAQFAKQEGGAILVANTLSSGVSTNALMAASYAIFVDLEWVPDDLIQAEGRFLRIGQKNHVLLEYIVAAKTVDEAQARTMVERLNRSEVVLGIGKQAKGLRSGAKKSGLVNANEVALENKSAATVAEALKAMRLRVAETKLESDFDASIVGGKETDFLLDEDEDDAQIPF